MRGKGSGFCPTLLNDQAAANAGSDPFSIQYDETWVLGFVSALAINGDVDLFRQTDAPAFMSAVEGQCMAHPEETIGKAASDVFNQSAPAAVQLHLTH